MKNIKLKTKNSKKIKSDSIAKMKSDLDLIDSFCKHLESGMSEHSFIEKDFREIREIADSIDKINNNKEQYEKIMKAFRISYNFWEKLAIKMMTDKETKHNYNLWIFYMKCRFHWGIIEEDEKINEKKEININLTLTDSKKRNDIDCAEKNKNEQLALYEDV